jgi:hypothetical protein
MQENQFRQRRISGHYLAKNAQLKKNVSASIEPHRFPPPMIPRDEIFIGKCLSAGTQITKTRQWLLTALI